MPLKNYPLSLRHVSSAALLAAAIGLATLAGSAVAGQGDKSGINQAAASPDAAGPVAKVDAALTVAAFGREQEDPTILLGAARMLQLIGQSQPDGEVTGTGEVPEGDKAVAAMGEKSEDAAEGGDLVDALVQEARFLARGDETLLARADAIADSATKGSTTGPGYYDRRVEAGSYVDIAERFRGNEVAEVLLQGDGDTDVDLIIFDENGNAICEALSGDDRETCRWIPAWTGSYTIRLLNYGGVYNNTRVWTN